MVLVKMKAKYFFATLLLVGTLGGSMSSFAADKKAEKSKPYPLDKCIVSDEKLGEMGDPLQAVLIGAAVEAVFEPHDSADPPYTLVQWRLVTAG